MSDQSNINWQTEREMTPLEFQLTVSAMGMSQAAAGRYLGVSAKTVQRYIRGEATIPTASVLLLRGLVAGGLDPLVPKRKRR